MSNQISTRRRFFLTAGAAVSAPAALTSAAIANESESASLAGRLAELEDYDALRRISAELLSAVNAGAQTAVDWFDAARAGAGSPDTTLHDIAVEDFDAIAQIAMSSDRRSATVRVPCTARFDEPIDAPGSALLDMARGQGEGFLRQAKAQVLELRCERAKAGWRLAHASLRER